MHPSKCITERKPAYINQHVQTQKAIEHHEFELKIFVLIQNFCTWVFTLHSSLRLLPYALLIDYVANVTMIQVRVSISVFPLAPKTV
jgi:hypothetical protein